MKHLGGLVAALVVGCSAAGEPAEFDVGPLRLTPQKGHEYTVVAAAARWEGALGLPVQVVPEGGVPVLFVPQVFVMGVEACGGLTHTMSGRLVRIEIATDPSGYCSGGALLHELGHAIVRHYGDDNSMAPDHLELDGHLMSSPSNATTWIDEMSLELVCESVPCALFNPEM
jgi:hypothetical protein